MFLKKIGVLRIRAFALQSFSKAVSCLVLVSMLAVSMPAAPRMMVEASGGVRRLITSFDTTSEGLLPIIPAFDTSLPSFDPSPLSAIFTESLAFAGRANQIVCASESARRF